MASPARRRIRAALFELAVVYVLLNLGMANFATMIHELRLRVEVVDAGGAPITGATVVELARLHVEERLLGATTTEGVVVLDEMVQQQPLWVWPKIGSFDFRDRTLRVAAAGRRTELVQLREVLPAVPLSAGAATVRVTLRPE